MKILIALMALAMLPLSASAKVEFTGGNWFYQTAESEVIQSIGLTTDPTGEMKVTLNLAGRRQVMLSGPHTQAGLALTDFQGKCVKIIPGQKLQSVSFILNCERPE